MLRFVILIIVFCYQIGALDLFSQNSSKVLSSNNISQAVGYKQRNSNSLISVINEVVGGKGDIVVSSHNIDNQIMWSKKFDLESQKNDVAYDFIIDRDGNIVIVGACVSSHCFILKLDGNNGSILFSKKINTPTHVSNRLNRIYQMRQNISDDYIIMGIINYNATHYAGRITKNGNTVWSKEYNCVTNNELAYTLTEALSGDVIIGGHNHNAVNHDHMIIKINSSNGNFISFNAYDMSYSTARNGGFDDAVAIPNTPYIAFSAVINGGGLATRNGVVIYNTQTNSVERFEFYNVGFDSRGMSIQYLASQNKLLIGGFIIQSGNYIQMIQLVNYNDLKDFKTYKHKNNTVLSSVYSNSVFSHNGSEILLAGSIRDLNNASIIKAIVSKLDSINLDCFEPITGTLISAVLPNKTTPAYNFVKDITIVNSSPSQTDYTYQESILCESGCKPTSKLFKLNISKKRDTICQNAPVYNPIITISNNVNDTIIDVTAYKKNGNSYTLLSTLKKQSTSSI
jgi:hypothetical protein